MKNAVCDVSRLGNERRVSDSWRAARVVRGLAARVTHCRLESRLENDESGRAGARPLPLRSDTHTRGSGFSRRYSIRFDSRLHFSAAGRCPLRAHRTAAFRRGRQELSNTRLSTSSPGHSAILIRSPGGRLSFRCIVQYRSVIAHLCLNSSLVLFSTSKLSRLGRLLYSSASSFSSSIHLTFLKITRLRFQSFVYRQTHIND